MRLVVLGMSTPAKMSAAPALEPQRGGVVERYRHLTKQRPAVAIECLLDRLRVGPHLADVLSQPGHRFVGMIKREFLSTRNLKRLPPAAGVAIRARHH